MAKVGETLGRYAIAEALGRGGSGTVFRAVDTRLDSAVCLKILHPALANDPEAMKRFEREVLVARKIQHPGVCQVFDVQEHEGEHFLVMEWVEGRPLSEVLKKQRFDVGGAVRLVRSIAQAVAAAHVEGVIHRDLKPQNVMVLPSGEVKVLDFGIAASAGLGRLTEPGTVMGTAAFLPPEGLAGQAPTPAWDVWSLGVLLYRLLGGRLPFRARTFEELRALILAPEPAPLSTLAPNVPADLSAVVERALQKQPTDRFVGAAELDLALAPYVALDVSAGRPAAPGGDERNEATQVVRVRQPIGEVTVPTRRSRAGLFAGVVVALALVGALAVVFLRGQSPAPPPPPAPALRVTLPVPSTADAPPPTPDLPPSPAPTAATPAAGTDAGALTAAGALADAGDGDDIDAAWEILDEAVAGERPATTATGSAARSGTARAAYRRDRKRMQKALQARALRPGDSSAVDAARRRMVGAARRGRYVRAAAAAREAEAAVRSVVINKDFVFAKLKRFNRLYDAAEDPELRTELGTLAVEVNRVFRAGDHEGAHRLLNRGFRSAKRTR